jgi:hypothetical protein
MPLHRHALLYILGLLIWRRARLVVNRSSLLRGKAGSLSAAATTHIRRDLGIDGNIFIVNRRLRIVFRQRYFVGDNEDSEAIDLCSVCYRLSILTTVVELASYYCGSKGGLMRLWGKELGYC